MVLLLLVSRDHPGFTFPFEDKRERYMIRPFERHGFRPQPTSVVDRYHANEAFGFVVAVIFVK